MATKHLSRSDERGFTLVELTVAVAVVAVLAATAAPSLAAFVALRRVDAVAVELAADVQLTRGEAVARNRPLRLAIQGNAGASCWVVHTGNAGQCSCTASGPAVCSGGAIAIKSMRVDSSEAVVASANVSNMLFDPLHGTVTPTGTLRVEDARGRAVQHVVNVMARTRSCSPNGAVPGWRPC